jgi:methylated-DNA-protein-cysteine methyltransferase-like protein
MTDQTLTTEQKFQKIWQTVATIPKGCVMSYGQVAMAAGMPRRARFVSKALKAAPDELQLPWFRVVRSDGSIAFPSDSDAFVQQSECLRAEGVEVKNGRIQKSQYHQTASEHNGQDRNHLDFLLWAMDDTP